MSEQILGWRINRNDRARLLERFPPRYANVVADHVTFGGANEAPPLPNVVRATIVGRADDGHGVEALVVALQGSTERPTGGTYHITWSLAEGREPIESNDLIANSGWEPVEPGARVRLEAASWP